MPNRENSYIGYFPPKCTCDVHIAFRINIPVKNMLILNGILYAMLGNRMTLTHALCTESLPTPIILESLLTLTTHCDVNA